MSTWNVVWSVGAVVATSVVAITAIGCVWPSGQRRKPTTARRHARTRCALRPVQWPQAWTCTPPTRPLTLTEAHHAMQLHREHTCARKQAAFAALVTAGRATPDSARRHRLWESGE